MNEPGADPIIERLREQIAATDRDLLDAFARRVALAAQVRERKVERGLPLIDEGRERELLELWRQSANGTLSREAVEELFAAVLALSKRESAR